MLRMWRIVVHGGVLPLLLVWFYAARPSSCRATQKNVIAYVQSKWADTPLVVEASEFMAHEGDGYFWKFIEVLGKNESNMGSGIGLSMVSLTLSLLICQHFPATDEIMYERLIGIAKSVLDSKSRVKLFQFALAIRCYSPSVEMYRQLSLSLSGRPAGHVFVDVHGQLSANINSLDELLNQAIERSPPIFSFDHLYAARSNKAKKWAILYANLESNDFITWHNLLKSRAKKGELNYVFRHLPRLRIAFKVGKGKVPLSGYSVELAIKSTEYKAQDDAKIRSKPTAGTNLTDDGDEEETDLDGFNIRLLKLLHPELRDKLDEFKLHLLEADELAPLKVWQLQDLSFQAGQRILLAAKEDVLHTLQELSQNFPLMASILNGCQARIPQRSGDQSSTVWRVVSRTYSLRLKEAFSEFGIEPGDSAIFINGMRIDLDEMDIFALLDKLKKEERLLAGFFDMGFRVNGRQNMQIASFVFLFVQKETQSLLYRISSETSSSKFAVDYTQWLPDVSWRLAECCDFASLVYFQFVNDLEKDPQYRQWGNSVQLLLQPYFPGMIRPIARNFFTLVRSRHFRWLLVIHFAATDARRYLPFNLATTAQEIFCKLRNRFTSTKAHWEDDFTSCRVGLILATNPDKKVSGYSDGGVALLNAYNFVKGDKSIERALKFVLHVYSRVPSGNVTSSDVIDVFKQKYPDEDLTTVFDVDSDYNTGRQRWAQFAQSSGLNKLPSVLLNGFPMADNDVTSDQFEEAVVLEVSQVTSELQRAVLEGKLTDGVDVQRFILNKPFVLPKLNPKVLATDNKALILTDVMGRAYVGIARSSQSVAVSEYKVSTVGEFKKLERKQQNQYIVQSRRYLTKNDESILRPVTLWVVANVATKDGRDLYLAAIRSLKQLPNERVGLIHNIARKDKVGYAIASLIQACLKLPLHQAKVVITKMLEKQLKSMEELEKLDIHGVDWNFLQKELNKKGEDIVAIDSYYSTRILNIPSGKVGLIINGIILSDVTSKDFSSAEDFALIEKYLLSSGCKVIASQIRKWNVPHEDGRSSDLVMRVFSLLKAYASDTKRQWVTPLMQNDSCVDILSKDMMSATFEIVAIVDPLSASAQQISHLLSTIGHVINADITLCMNCKPKLSDIPLKRFLRVAIPTQLEFNQDGSLKRQPVARFSILPQKQLFTLNVIAPHSWLVEATEAAYDLDNIKMSDAFTDVVGIFELEHLLLEGHCFDEVTGSPPRGLQFTLGTAEQPVMFDTIVMANLGYFQLKANPGAWLLRLREGRSKEIYKVNSLDGAQVSNDERMVVILDNFGGLSKSRSLLPNFASRSNFGSLLQVAKKPDKFEEELLPTSGEEDEESSLWQSISKFVTKFTSSKDDYDVLNVFSLASGHLYERFLRSAVYSESVDMHCSKIMMLSVMKHAKSPVKFWLLKNYLSPHFKAFLPFMAKRYKFSYELVQYKWPRWLHQQTVKQRVMWGYKILFLDVLFPLDVKKIIFVDADQVVRTNLMDLMKLDLEGAPYGYTPFCDSRKEMEGYRFWKTGYWKQHLGDRKYHISALYVVDLKKFRQIAAGDRLRGQYHGLSKDPNSLSNLDQCNNPMTKEPKLQSAMRIIEEWRDYDAEIKKLLDEYDRQRGIERSASNEKEEEEEEEPQQPSGTLADKLST
ncbi:udp glucose:glycoprotein glucosyltransferase [Trichuris trichiura]|uniref:Udp glucose:glycoprotein glucosyltransferase n=1 Tax=Trichuris trichiura TaxID=36087 RepID=A0A077YXS6_TRITR|nr:udp glucose:glycoprotein glucosyltransferase [Trichuris trichiura]